MAGLQTIPQHLYDAAAIDGAGRWHRFARVTLPLLRPTTTFLFVTSTLGAFQVFEQVSGSNLAGGKVAIQISGPGVARPAADQGKDSSVGAWPMLKRVRQASFAYHNSNIVYAKTKVRDEALKLLKHLSSTDGIIALNAPSRSALPRKSAVEKADWMKDPRMQLVQDAAGVYGVNEGRSRYWIPIRDNYWVPALDRVWLGQASAEQACAQAAKEARDYIAKADKG